MSGELLRLPEAAELFSHHYYRTDKIDVLAAGLFFISVIGTRATRYK